MCVCLRVAIYRKFKLNERIQRYNTYIFQVETMEPSLNSTPMDLLNATEDASPCNSTPMNRAHALGVSVGEARVQRDCVGYMELQLKLKYTWQLIPCLPVQIIDGRMPTGSTNFDYDGGRGRFR